MSPERITVLPGTLFRFQSATKRAWRHEIRYGDGVNHVSSPSSRAALPSIMAIAVVAICIATHSVSRADVDNQQFTSRARNLKLTVPKGWRPSELPSYPGVLLWMLRSQPPGWIIVADEPLRQQLVCSWPVECRTASEPLSARYACALGKRLEGKDVLLGPLQSGPKENVAAGIPSVWFEFTDGQRFVRQALAVNERRAITLVLSTSSAAARATHARAFDQVLRSLGELSQGEARLPVSARDGVNAEPSRATTAEAIKESPSIRAPTPAPSPPIAAPLFDPSYVCP
jgi:hypothetical protein